MARPSVSVIVPTCRDATAIERVLTSILATGYEPLDVVVVENRPPAPETRAVVERRFAGRPVRYVEAERRGASAARNAGLSEATAEFVAFTDDDVSVDPSWIDNAMAAFERTPEAACVTGRILPLALSNASQVLFEQFATFDKGPERRVFRLPESRDADPLFPYIAGHVGSGGNIFIRREVAQGLAGFDLTLGPGTPAVGGEDLDLFIRLAHAGRTIVYDPGVIVRHDHPDRMNGVRHHAFRYGIGLTAMLLKQMVRGPGRLSLLRAVPAGARYALDRTSRKNVNKRQDYPRSLELLERLGMMLGPLAYLLSLASSTIRERVRDGAR